MKATNRSLAERRGRAILRALGRRPMTLAELETAARREPGSSDRADLALKTRARLRMLRAQGLVIDAPAGLVLTAAGAARLREAAR